MRHLSVLGCLTIVLSIWSLASCGAPGPTAVAKVTVTPSPVSTRTPTSAPELAVSGTELPSRTPWPTAGPSRTRSPTPTALTTPRPTPTRAPTLPPIESPAGGGPLALALDWYVSANGHLTAGAVTELSGRPAYLLASLGRSVYALSESGEVLWRARTGGPVYALAVLAGERIAAGDDAGFVTLLDARGQQLWRYDLGSRVTALHSWQGGLLASGWDERLTFLSDKGDLRWQADLDGPVSGIAALPNLALAATLDGGVWAFDPDGTEAWRFDVGAPVTRLGTDGERALVGGQDGRLLALDANGALRWQLALGTGGPVWHVANLVGDAAPEIVAGTGGAEPSLTLLTRDGEALWRVALPAPAGALAILEVDGAPEILAGLMDGRVQVYDAQGRRRGAVQAGLPVWGLEPAGQGAALVLADVVAWRLSAGDGPQGGAWLPSPALVSAPLDALPPEAAATGSQAVLVFLGDVTPGRSVEQALARYGPAYPWGGLEPLLAAADLAVANLEGVLTTGGDPLDKSYLVRAHPRQGRMLAAGGLDLVTLANNHALDYGQAGLDETLARLDELGIVSVGAGRSREEAHRPALFDLNGVRLAVLGYAAARWNGSKDVPATENIAWAEVAAVQADVQALRDQADVVIVLLHAGTEYAAEPSADQVAVAHAAIDAGADLVVGHHPHVTQTVERYGDGLIVYSLGDAVFDIPRPAAMRGDLLRVHVARGGLVQAELWPFWIDAEHGYRPRLLDDGQGAPRFEIVYP